MNDEIKPVKYPNPPEMKRMCILYLDILGYKQFLKMHKGNSLTLIHRCFENAKLFINDYNTHLDLEKIKIKVYSDNLILSAELDGEIEDYGIYHDMIVLSACLQETAIVTCNLQFRGAVTAGNCHVDDDFVFGDAFMEAYELESKVADWGRVIVSEDIVKAIQPHVEELDPRLISDNFEGKEIHYIDFLGISNNPTIDDNYVCNTK